MGLSVRSIENTNNLQDVVNQVNLTNNEMTQDFNLLKEELRLRRGDIKKMEETIGSLTAMVRELYSYKVKPSVIKKTRAKNIRLGTTNASTVDKSTLFQADDGSLNWSDESGNISIIIP